MKKYYLYRTDPGHKFSLAAIAPSIAVECIEFENYGLALAQQKALNAGIKSTRKPGAGRKKTGRQRLQFTTTLDPETIAFLETIKPDAGRWIDERVREFKSQSKI